MLPELYQPIYGHPEFGGARAADLDRVDLVVELAALVGDEVGRPLRVLDLGSSQGFVSCRLAEAHHVTGVEYLQANVDVARAVAAEHPELDVSFVLGDISDVVRPDGDLGIDVASYDFVIGLSVLHHLVHRDGLEATRGLVADLCRQVPFGLFEMALRDEPLYWAASQPADPRETLAPYPFIREVARSSTHLSDIRRPLLFCSRTHVLAAGELRRFQRWTSDGHDQSGPAQRAAMRYFHLDDAIVKVAAPFAPDVSERDLGAMRADLRCEAHVLEVLGPSDDVPTVIESAETSGDTVLARTLLPGVLLSDVVDVLDDDERVWITTEVLDRLAVLEAEGLYHADLRTWNVLVERPARRARIIDLGALRTSATDTVWPHDAHFSLLLFVCALWAGRRDRSAVDLPRTLDITEADLPPRAVRLVRDIVQADAGDDLFARLATRWRATSSSEPSGMPPLPVVWPWLVAHDDLAKAKLHAEREVAELHRHLAEAQLRAEQLVADLVSAHERDAAASERLQDAELRLVGAAAEIEALAANRDALWFEHQAVLDDRSRVVAELAVIRDELAAIRGSRSWRAIGVVRRVARGITRRG